MYLRIAYWTIPIVAGLVWLCMLLALLGYWLVNAGRVHYISMNDTGTFAFISDIGASTLKPYFIASCIITALLLDLSFVLDRWLRYRVRLAPNKATLDMILIGLTAVFTLIGTICWISLSVVDIAAHKPVHRLLLSLFIVAYLFSAIFICWEYWRLSTRNPDNRIFAISFRIKLAFVMVELALAVAFAATIWTEQWDASAYIEWAIGFIFALYIFSFAIDLFPAAQIKREDTEFDKRSSSEVEEMESGSLPPGIRY